MTDGADPGAPATQPWDGRGLPPAALARIERARRSHVRTSLLSVPSAAAARGVGLEPVGEVMGCLVERISWAGYGCGIWGYGTNPRYVSLPVQISTRSNGAYGPYVRALYDGFEGALHRMLLEAQALGADGVVGVRWTRQRIDDNNQAWEFVAMGTAVRARTTVRPAHLFASDLPGTDVAKLMGNGWVPTGLALGIAVAVRHDDYAMQTQTSAFAGNVEVSGYTDLVLQARAHARQEFEQRAARQGGDGAVMSDLSLNVWEVEQGNEHRDHVAQATAVGTTIAAIPHHALEPRATLMTMPLVGTDRRNLR